mmetsp:Transcript_3978/g.25048  ORF Transcript_3978/g.25048 Transcript_3978/m.25048 type:complete len:88 (+) Transcript_3978:393-656(+)
MVCEVWQRRTEKRFLSFTVCGKRRNKNATKSPHRMHAKDEQIPTIQQGFRSCKSNVLRPRNPKRRMHGDTEDRITEGCQSPHLMESA